MGAALFLILSPHNADRLPPNYRRWRYRTIDVLTNHELLADWFYGNECILSFPDMQPYFLATDSKYGLLAVLAQFFRNGYIVFVPAPRTSFRSYIPTSSPTRHAQTDKRFLSSINCYRLNFIRTRPENSFALGDFKIRLSRSRE